MCGRTEIMISTANVYAKSAKTTFIDYTANMLYLWYTQYHTDILVLRSKMSNP